MNLETLLYDFGLIEQRGRVKTPKNILVDKERRNDREVSRQNYLTISSEIDDEMDKAKRHQIDVCAKKKTIRGQFPCIIRTKVSLISKIEKLKKDCVKSKYHKQRCIRKCDSLINFLEESIRRMNIHLRRVEKKK